MKRVIKSRKLQRRRLRRFLVNRRQNDNLRNIFNPSIMQSDIKDNERAERDNGSESNMSWKENEREERDKGLRVIDMSWREEEEEREVREFSVELGCVCVIMLSVVLTYRHLMFSSNVSYTNFDDDVNFLKNQYLRSNLSYESVKWIVTDGQILRRTRRASLQSVRDMVVSTRSIEEEAQCILKTSVCLHVLNSVLCVCVCNRIHQKSYEKLFETCDTFL